MVYYKYNGRKGEFSELSSCDPCDDANIHGIVLPLVHSHLDLAVSVLYLLISPVLASSVAPALCLLFLSVARHRKGAVGPSLVGSSLVSTLEQYAIISTRGQLINVPVVVRLIIAFLSVTEPRTHTYIYIYTQTKVEI